MAVYFMQAGDGGPVKIGYAGDVQRRRHQVQVHSAAPITLLGVIPAGTLADEAAMHRRFSRCRLRGEWFRPEPDLLEVACQHAIRRPRAATPFARYLQDHNLTLEAFGERAGLSTATISRLARGLHKPDWGSMEKIREATGDKVQPNDWTDIPDEAPEAAA